MSLCCKKVSKIKPKISKEHGSCLLSKDIYCKSVDYNVFMTFVFVLDIVSVTVTYCIAGFYHEELIIVWGSMSWY